MLVYQCNNPLTKEPKLSAAVRIVGEWTAYDDEVKALWDRIYKNGSSSSSSASDVDTAAAASSGQHTPDTGEL